MIKQNLRIISRKEQKDLKDIRYIVKPQKYWGFALYLKSIEERVLKTMNNTNIKTIVEKLEEYQDRLELEIKDNQDAIEVWGIFSKLIDKLENIDYKQTERNI